MSALNRDKCTIPVLTQLREGLMVGSSGKTVQCMVRNIGTVSTCLKTSNSLVFLCTDQPLENFDLSKDVHSYLP